MKSLSTKVKRITENRRTSSRCVNTQYTGKLRIINSRGFKGRSISDKTLNQYQEKSKEPMTIYYY